MGSAPVQAMIISGFVLPVVLVISRTPYMAFKRYVRMPWFFLAAAVAFVWSLVGGSWGFLGICIVVPYLQVAVFALFAQIYRLTRGRELDQPAITAFYQQGKFALQLFDNLACLVVIGLPFGIAVAYAAYSARFSPV